MGDRIAIKPPTNIPQKMIVEDFNEGYYVITFKQIKETPKHGEPIPIYQHRRYFHKLEDALKEIEEDDIRLSEVRMRS